MLVLIVEDSDAEAYAIAHALRRAIGSSLSIQRARSAAEVAERIAQGVVPDLVLLDMVLVGRNGEDALGLLRASPAHRFVPVVVLSGSDVPLDRRRMLERGANAYVRKPFGGHEDLIRAIAKVFL